MGFIVIDWLIGFNGAVEGDGVVVGVACVSVTLGLVATGAGGVITEGVTGVIETTEADCGDSVGVQEALCTDIGTDWASKKNPLPVFNLSAVEEW